MSQRLYDVVYISRTLHLLNIFLPLLLLQIMAEGRSEEHSLEYQELFNEYLLMFEGKLEEFIGEAGCGI